MKIEIIADLTDLEGKVTSTVERLPLHLRKGFFESVLNLVRSGAGRLVYFRSGESKRVDSADGAAAYTLIPRIGRFDLVGIDELCAAALGASGAEAGN
ncbi:hypothetical protein [Pseudomonas sp. SWI44]|uniref:hypothetical protein n=1 Tax=Pseudomonas sp. SWI44 TaxID=2083053 RepID=UPI00131A0EA1|nr:hypothetical protein [Pseudomonas sp. SWI44]